MTDGTPLKWRQAKTGYYIPESFAPRNPDGHLLWSYAMAYRLSEDKNIWKMLGHLTRTMGIGDIGSPAGTGQALKLDTENADWRMIYALLELHRATDSSSMMKMARRIADNLLKLQTSTGLFPRAGRRYARTGDEIPLALLHLAAALEGQSDKMLPPMFDGRFFHCEYHGELAENQKKRGDKRTYDNYVFYGSP
jgi:pectate lyase